MLAQEIRLLPDTKGLILVQGHSPVYANKLLWFKDARFKKRILSPEVIEPIFHLIDQSALPVQIVPAEAKELEDAGEEIKDTDEEITDEASQKNQKQAQRFLGDFNENIPSQVKKEGRF